MSTLISLRIREDPLASGIMTEGGYDLGGPALQEDTMFDVDEVEALLRASARAGRAISYSEALMALGLGFSRPKMRALCKVLDAIDERARPLDQPELAVLVVRESDRLPGQGWWVGRADYSGPWVGPQARAFVDTVQRRAFDYWRASPDADDAVGIEQ